MRLNSTYDHLEMVKVGLILEWFPASILYPVKYE